MIFLRERERKPPTESLRGLLSRRRIKKNLWDQGMFNEEMTYRLRHRYREDLGKRLSCFGFENKNGAHFTRFKSKNYSWK